MGVTLVPIAPRGHIFCGAPRQVVPRVGNWIGSSPNLGEVEWGLLSCPSLRVGTFFAALRAKWCRA